MAASRLHPPSQECATTLLPALLSLYGRRGSMRVRIRRRRHTMFWPRLARSIMRRPFFFLAGGSAFLLLTAAPALGLRLTPGSADGVPQTLPSVRGFDILRGAVGAGALSPTQVVIDSGRPGGTDAGVGDPGVGQFQANSRSLR